MMKKLLISGCSFSYGSGLELFHPDINGKDWPERQSDWNKATDEVKRFIQANRWSKLLADKLGLEEVNVSKPGNSNLSSSLSLKGWINENGLEGVDTIIFQLTISVRAATLPDESEVLTGSELAMYLERYLKNFNAYDYSNNPYVMAALNMDSNLERNQVCIQDLVRMFDEYTKMGIKCYFLEWVEQSDEPIPYKLNLFGTGETVNDWSDRRRLKGGHWMEDMGYQTYSWEGHLGLEGCKELANEIYNSIK